MKRMRWLGTAVTVAVLGACGRSGDPVASGEVPELPADMVLVGMTQIITKNGVAQAEFRADTAYMDEATGNLDARGVHLKVFNEHGVQAAELTSRSGVFNSRNQSLTARGNVVVHTVEGARRIETEVLNYDPRGDRIWSDVATTIHEEGRVVQGDGFEADGRMRIRRINHPRATGLRLEFE
mgnify:FL=1